MKKDRNKFTGSEERLAITGLQKIVSDRASFWCCKVEGIPLFGGGNSWITVNR